MPGLRKPNHRLGGLEVRICGHLIQKEGDIVCTLPALPRHRRHAAMASNSEEEIFAFIEMEDGDTLAWRLVGPRE